MPVEILMTALRQAQKLAEVRVHNARYEHALKYKAQVKENWQRYREWLKSEQKKDIDRGQRL